ncbi:MAG: zinc ribbon domain-containing protein [Treponematales bacterium]
MPTYEYECKSCGRRFEAFQSMKDAPLSDCPECGGGVHRLINGGGGVIFKGSGFYVTDRKGAGAPAKAGKPAKPEAPACAPGCAKAEAGACPAAAPEKKPQGG